MVHAATMAATGDRLESARSRAIAAIDHYAAEMRHVEGSRLGEGLIATRALKDRVEAVFAEGLRRFDQSGRIRRGRGDRPGGLAALEVQAFRWGGRRAGRDRPPAP